MTTKEDIYREFDIDSQGFIRNPGKFEGEAAYAPYFSDLASYGEELSAMEDGCGAFVALVKIEADDRSLWPMLSPDTVYVIVRENDQGFVGVGELTENAANEIRAEFAKAADSDEDESA